MERPHWAEESELTGKDKQHRLLLIHHVVSEDVQSEGLSCPEASQQGLQNGWDHVGQGSIEEEEKSGSKTSLRSKVEGSRCHFHTYCCTKVFFADVDSPLDCL